LTIPPHGLTIPAVFDKLPVHEKLILARKAQKIDQAKAADLIGIGLHDFVAIERGRMIPTPFTAEGSTIAAAIEREFGIPASAWVEQPAQAVAS
jgi:DNA-binding XRE family transcriptional regulator